MNKKRLIIIILGTIIFCFFAYTMFVIYMINSTPGGAKVGHDFEDYYANIEVDGDTLKIVDNRTNLNGLTIKKIASNSAVADDQFKNIKIIITDCGKLKNSPNKSYEVKSDCAFFNPGISRRVDGVEYAMIDPQAYNYNQYQDMMWINYDEGDDIPPPGLWSPLTLGYNLVMIKNYYFITTKNSLYKK